MKFNCSPLPFLGQNWVPNSTRALSSLTISTFSAGSHKVTHTYEHLNPLILKFTNPTPPYFKKLSLTFQSLFLMSKKLLRTVVNIQSTWSGRWNKRCAKGICLIIIPKTQEYWVWRESFLKLQPMKMLIKQFFTCCLLRSNI